MTEEEWRQMNEEDFSYFKWQDTSPQSSPPRGALRYSDDSDHDELYANPSPGNQFQAPAAVRSSPLITVQSPGGHGTGNQSRNRATSKVSSKVCDESLMMVMDSASPPICRQGSNSPAQRESPGPPRTPVSAYIEDMLEKKLGKDYKPLDKMDQYKLMEASALASGPSGYGKAAPTLTPRNKVAGSPHSRPSTSASSRSFDSESFAMRTKPSTPREGASAEHHGGLQSEPLPKKTKTDTTTAAPRQKASSSSSRPGSSPASTHASSPSATSHANPPAQTTTGNPAARHTTAGSASGTTTRRHTSTTSSSSKPKDTNKKDTTKKPGSWRKPNPYDRTQDIWHMELVLVLAGCQ